MADDDNSLSPPPKKKVVIIAGAGVIGTTTAYYLAKEFGIASILVDPTGTIAPAASGKAGGFLALDWNDYSPVGPLSRRSFSLHQDLAETLGAEQIQYRRLTCASIVAAAAMATPTTTTTTTTSSSSSSSSTRPKGKKLEGVEWVDSATGMRPLGDEETIAQVHPKLLCQSLFAATQQLQPETRLVKGKVIAGSYRSTNADDNQKLVGATLDDGTIIAGDALLFACGPWQAEPYNEAPTPANRPIMTGVKYHSLVVPTTQVLSQCVFFSGCGDPEVYVRPDSTAYCTGFPDPAIVVTEPPGHEQVRPEAIDCIRTSVQQASSFTSLFRLDSSKEELQQACYLPTTLDGIPIMGSLNPKKHPQSFVAAGHSCWGILMGPASGEAMAHWIATGTSPHVDLTPFAPSRFGL
jgi:glycine/D-amino acid oxidase-like deaminating enzyme